MPYRAGNLIDTAQNWTRRVSTNMKMGAILGSDRYQLVRYEDLVLNAEATLRRVCDFAGVAYAHEMMDYPNMVDEKVPKDRRWLWPALGRPPDESKVYAWKRNMPFSKRIVFEGEAKFMLDELSYETFQEIPKRISAYARELGYLLGRGGRFARIASKIGFRPRSRLERSWSSRHRYESIQKRTFKDLAESGVYGTDFDHAAPLKGVLSRMHGTSVRAHRQERRYECFGLRLRARRVARHGLTNGGTGTDGEVLRIRPDARNGRSVARTSARPRAV